MTHRASSAKVRVQGSLCSAALTVNLALFSAAKRKYPARLARSGPQDPIIAKFFTLTPSSSDGRLKGTVLCFALLPYYYARFINTFSPVVWADGFPLNYFYVLYY